MLVSCCVFAYACIVRLDDEAPQIIVSLMTTQYLMAHNNNKYFHFATQNIAKMGPTSQDDKDLF